MRVLHFICILACIALAYTADLTFTNVDRSIDLTTQLARHTVEVDVTNSGSKDVQIIEFNLPSSMGKLLSFSRVTFEDGQSVGLEFVEESSKKVNDESLAVHGYHIHLPQPLKSGQSIHIQVYLVFSHTMHALPREITQYERQLMKYGDSHFLLSAYDIKKMITIVKLPSKLVSSFSNHRRPTTNVGDVITYGPYENVSPFSFDPFDVHFENNSPFLTVKNLKREIEISHWGNIAVEEHYDVVHTGAKLKGSFSRYDFQMNPQGSGLSSVNLFRQYLPFEAADVYYRDDIGNISTSAVNMDNDESGIKHRLDLRPRFPLFGGWQTKFYMGYNLPTESNLFYDNESGRYVLNMTFIAQWDQSIVIEDEEVHVIFPEGTSDIQYELPFEIDGIREEMKLTYLDYFGRPVLVLNKKNLVNEHFQYFTVSYKYSGIYIEPALLILGFFTLFSVAIFGSRLWSFIAPPLYEDKEKRE